MIFAECVVKFEVCVLDCLGNAVNFIATVMYNNFRILNRHNVDLSISKLLLENWPLLKTDANFHLICESMATFLCQFLTLSLNHVLEIDINLDALKLVIGFSLTFQLSGFLHS